MGAWGAIIMGLAGTVFATLTLARPLQWHGIVLATPALPYALIVLLALWANRQPGPRLSLAPRAGRVMLWSSAGEGIGIFLAANIVINLRRPEWLLPAMTLVVGLHFVPIAMATRLRAYWGLGTALLAIAALGFLLGAPLGGEVAGFGAALALWVAALLAIRREVRARTRGGGLATA